ncbi:olfactory receptor 5V1-like [Ambystoma mexicanum]|uniref:olfactory receptor 5V1-like n=1 Tax=Ambystoma mexicanum TaxID=8296 RepID=UPI0037E87EEF
MDDANGTIFTDFILMGFTSFSRFHTLLFTVLLSIYSITLAGNVAIILVTWLDPHLYKPMYFFLGNLSFLDICYTSSTVPKMLETILSEKKTISYTGCVIQLYTFFSFVGTECVLLAAMSYDRYVAICKPLLYHSIMKHTVCFGLASFSWLSGFMNSVLHTTLVFRLPFCSSNKVNYFFCDIPPLLSLACSDTSLNKMMLLIIGVFIAWTPFLCIIVSYVFIISSILKMRSGSGSRKAFSTCASHLTVVILFYGSCIFNYLQTFASGTLDKDHLLSAFYSFVTPMLNPVIYTLKNQEVKLALKKAFFSKGLFSQ